MFDFSTDFLRRVRINKLFSYSAKVTGETFVPPEKFPFVSNNGILSDFRYNKQGQHNAEGSGVRDQQQIVLGGRLTGHILLAYDVYGGDICPHCPPAASEGSTARS